MFPSILDFLDINDNAVPAILAVSSWVGLLIFLRLLAWFLSLELHLIDCCQSRSMARVMSIFIQSSLPILSLGQDAVRDLPILSFDWNPFDDLFFLTWDGKVYVLSYAVPFKARVHFSVLFSKTFLYAARHVSILTQNGLRAFACLVIPPHNDVQYQNLSFYMENRQSSATFNTWTEVYDLCRSLDVDIIVLTAESDMETLKKIVKDVKRCILLFPTSKTDKLVPEELSEYKNIKIGFHKNLKG